jgi:hypothetical protein
MRKFYSSALFRGLVWQLAGWLVGALFLTGVRMAMGLSLFGPFFLTEPLGISAL